MMVLMAWEWEMMSMSQEYLMLQHLYQSSYQSSMYINDQYVLRQEIQSEKNLHEEQNKLQEISLPQNQLKQYHHQQTPNLPKIKNELEKEQEEPLDLSKPEKLWNQSRCKFAECQCNICGKTFSRPWLLKGIYRL